MRLSVCICREPPAPVLDSAGFTWPFHICKCLAFGLEDVFLVSEYGHERRESCNRVACYFYKYQYFHLKNLS